MKGSVSRPRFARYLPEQLEFLDYAYSRGVMHKGAKMTAREAAMAMAMMGTQLGFQQYGCGLTGGCRCPTIRTNAPTARQKCLWTPSEDGQCKFRASTLLEHWSFRTWFSGQKAQFKFKLEKAFTNNSSTTIDMLLVDADDAMILAREEGAE